MPTSDIQEKLYITEPETTRRQMRQIGKIATFGLIHGAWHGSWCWEYLVDELEERGHSAIAVDLPVDSPMATINEYSRLAATELQDAHDLVIVGHSMAGIILPEVAELIPVRKAIYLNAALRSPGKPLDNIESSDMPQRNPTDFVRSLQTIADKNNITVIPEKVADYYFYHDCHQEVSQWAISNLRPQNMNFRHEVSSQTEWSAVPSEYIIARNDRVVNPAWSEVAARNWLKVEPQYIDGGHSPFFPGRRNSPNSLYHWHGKRLSL